jgi:hypothetical protein
MSNDKTTEAVAKSHDILKNSMNCGAELDMFLGALARHPDWTVADLVELQRQLIVDFADQLCEQRL